MIWGDASEERFAEKLEIIRRDLAAGEVHLVMGFNEPDQPSQSNITVERAIELWPQLMELNAPLVSPGCVHPDGEWMRDFFEIAEQKNLRVDFVAVHSYGGLDAEALLRRLEKVHAEFARPLWITEFAVGDWQANSVAENRHRPEQIAEFMQEALPALEAADYVDRYAWFSALSTNKALGTSALIDANGELTPLGEIYCAH